MNVILGLKILVAGAVASSAVWADNQPPSTPTITYSIYSGKDAEVFWSRSTDDNPRIEYKLTRNGVTVYRGDGLSFFDSTLSTGTTYTYSLEVKGNDGLRAEPVSVSFATDQASAAAPVIGTPSSSSGPPAPTGLRVDVYSPNSFELFWNRVSSETLRYQVLHQGRVLGTTYGTSFFLNPFVDSSVFQSGSVVNLQVKALRSDGSSTTTYSAPVAISVSLSAGSTPTPPEPEPTPPIPRPPSAVASPENLSLVEYSDTAAELFWDRAPAEANIASTEVFRNGSSLGSTQGISFFDDTRQPGASYSYELVATNYRGQTSSPAILSTGSTTADPVGNPGGITQDPPSYRPNSVFVANPTDIGDYNAFYRQDGYDTLDVIRMNVRIQNTTQGVCNIDDQDGCTLNDLLNDIDGNDDFKVQLDVHAYGDGLPDDNSTVNATLRQRGNSARLAPQKSFRLKLKGSTELWRSEDRLQLNKNPNDTTRFKNKLSFDLFQAVPHFPSLRSQYVNLWIDNGQGLEDYGLFTHTEYVGKDYVANRGLGEDDNLYKIGDFRFRSYELNNIAVDAAGEPLNEDNFEAHLEIKNGKDHRAVVKMLEAMNDPNRSFESVLDEHFNRNNVLTWLATNLILRQADAITHNFYLYNPAGTERFYFLPWDYDGTFEIEPPLTDEFNSSFSNNDLAKRQYYGYARGLNSRFVKRWYRQDGAHDLLVAAIDELRANYYRDDQILQRATALNDAARPFLDALPDSEYASHSSNDPQRMVESIRQNYIDINNNYHVPMPPTVVKDPVIDSSGVLQLQWFPAFDVVGRSNITYDIIISRSADFRSGDTLYSNVGIADVETGVITHPVNTNLFPSRSQIFVRVIARPSAGPRKFWQTNSNVYRTSDGTTLFGVMMVDLAEQ